MYYVGISDNGTRQPIDNVFDPSPEDSLSHFGVKGMKWGVRRTTEQLGRNKRDGLSYAKPSKIRLNPDGSYTIPKKFVFNRVGKSHLDINKSGGLYVSSGKPDAARYVQLLGPTLINRILKTANTSLQHIEAVKDIRLASDDDVSKIITSGLLNNKDLMRSFKESIYSDPDITRKDIENASKKPASDLAKKIVWSVFGTFGDANYASDTKRFYDLFKAEGFDAIPDIFDRMNGTAETPLVIINPSSVRLINVQPISKVDLKEARQYVKTLEKIKVSDLLR